MKSRSGPNGGVAAGHITVLYGSKSGLRKDRRQSLNQDSPGVPGVSRAYINFGVSTAAGDFNGDHFADLAVGAFTERTPAGVDAGTITVFYGSAKGLGRAIAFTEPNAGAYGHWGAHLAATDINRDGRAELVIGGGAEAATHIGWFPSQPGRPAYTVLPEPQYYYSMDVVAGDITGDGYGDVIVTNAGEKMAVYLGGPNGLGPRQQEQYLAATSLALGDINGDGRADLVAGQGTWGRGGAIKVFLGAPKGLQTRLTITQNTPGVPGQDPGRGGFSDEFGADAAVGNVNGDRYADVAIGVPESHIGRKLGGYGAVVILKGGPKGLITSGAQYIHKDTKGVPGTPQSGGRFGGAVSLVDHNRDGKADLVVGGWGENHSMGGIWLFTGTKAGVSTTGTRFISPRDVAAPLKPNPEFGFRLSN
ncbi:FG-GAP repeat protein [Actinomadura barringtoniae]|uniref:FG-GAP repeat protein n=1 Tax=Actinomadura barringtoniae TaxID=1427535 RepID=A0A939PL71_9ACTN|nr:FG-GAP-like repeat-containing protein [Actinomadura barringtoniae]MBO2454367.1 FG-GAP repeat protein [Actinomadura barringtoniae]